MSVIIPAFNAERTIGEAVSSGLMQTYSPLEIVVIDDGSTDRTAQIIAGYGPLVRSVTQPRRGVSAARNAGIRAAHGAMIALLDADDVLLPPHVEAAVRVWTRAGGGRRHVAAEAAVYGASGIERRRVLPDRTPRRLDRQRRRIMEHNIVAMFHVYPRLMWSEIGGYDESMRAVEDWDFAARAVYSGWEVVRQGAPYALYRRGRGTLSTDALAMSTGERAFRAHILELFGASMSADERSQAAVPLRVGTWAEHVAAGEAALACGQPARAAEAFAAAAAVAPHDPRLRRKALALRVPGMWRAYAARQARRGQGAGLPEPPTPRPS